MENSLVAVQEQFAPQGEEICASDINFDRALPGLHQYLGTGFVDVGGRTYIEPGVETHMYAFYRAGVILVPGQYLPLIPFRNSEADLLKKLNHEKRPLIFLPGCWGRSFKQSLHNNCQDFIENSDSRNNIDDFVGCVGTTADLTALCITDPEEHTSIRAIFVGRQRIRITKTNRISSYPLVCHGVILPEASLNLDMATHPLGWGLIPRSWSRFASDPAQIQPFRSSSVGSLQGVNLAQSSVSTNGRPRKSSSPISSSPQPPLLPPAGNPLSVFDSRLSTWRYTGPISSGTDSSYFSQGGKLDHFVDDVAETVCKVPKVNVDQCSNGEPAASLLELDVEELQKSTHSSKITRSSSLSQDVELIMDRAVDRVGRPFRYRIKQPCDPRLLARRDVLAAVAQTYTAIPFWVYRQYDVNFLVSAIQTELFNWNDTWQMDRWSPELAVPFSYWLVQNLPMPGSLKSYLLGIDHVVQRLRATLDVLRQSAACVCAVCGANITSCKFIVCLAQEGSFQTYVNPSGVLHDIMTLSQVARNSLILVGDPSTEYSWFPGYTWTVANCSGCSHHMGWLFNATNEQLRPRRFWGIRRQALIPCPVNTPDWRPCV